MSYDVEAVWELEPRKHNKSAADFNTGCCCCCCCCGGIETHSRASDRRWKTAVVRGRGAMSKVETREKTTTGASLSMLVIFAIAQTVRSILSYSNQSRPVRSVLKTFVSVCQRHSRWPLTASDRRTGHPTIVYCHLTQNSSFANTTYERPWLQLMY